MLPTARVDILHLLRDLQTDRKDVRELAAMEITKLRRSLEELKSLAHESDRSPKPIPRKRKKAPYFPPGTPAKERLMAMVEVDHATGCWLWLGSGGTHYGHIRDDKGRNAYAHRLSYELHTGYRFKKGEKALHSCDNTWCVNPSHLRPGTNRENMEDKGRRGRHHNAKITLEQAKEIRHRYDEGEPGTILAKEFGISTTSVNQIIHGRIWTYDEKGSKGKKTIGKRKGERLSSLTPDDVRDIRKRSGRGETQASIAAIYDIAPVTVWAIVHRHRWASVR